MPEYRVDVGCECGVVVRSNWWTDSDKLEEHQETDKRKNLLAVKQSDPENWALALNPKTEKVKCLCGDWVCRWTLARHLETPSHLKRVPKRT